jgi:hypothetical protein
MATTFFVELLETKIKRDFSLKDEVIHRSLTAET